MLVYQRDYQFETCRKYAFFGDAKQYSNRNKVFEVKGSLILEPTRC